MNIVIKGRGLAAQKSGDQKEWLFQAEDLVCFVVRLQESTFKYVRRSYPKGNSPPGAASIKKNRFLHEYLRFPALYVAVSLALLSTIVHFGGIYIISFHNTIITEHRIKVSASQSEID
jgi:hypothetical protein